MCSLSGDIMIEENKSVKLKIDKCKKCLTEIPSIVLRKTDAYCKLCFLSATIHKFRATLGKYRIIRPNERVLILHQGGHPSTALLNFIRFGLDLPTHKKLRLVPIVLFIDEYEKLETDERLRIYTNISKEISSYNFSGYVTTLQRYMNNIYDDPVVTSIGDTLDYNILQKLEFEKNKTFPNRTSYEDSINNCRKQLIIKIAKQLKCGTIFTPDISVDVAINILNNLSLGRGSHLSLDTGIFDDRDADVKILQPLRYFDVKELAFYNIFNKLEPVNTKNINNNSLTPSINSLISKFVCDLQENYPSTIKTVVRTGDKLSCEKIAQNCNFCKAPIEARQELSSSEARNFSHWVSTNANNLNSNVIEEFNSQKVNPDKSLCYGCRNLSTVLNIS